jgi:hypothetical protein
MQGLLVPDTTVPSRAEGLWQHTCFEAFIRAGDDQGYLELNFSPSTQWAAYKFAGYRSGMARAELDAPEILVQRGADCLLLDVEVDIAGFGSTNDAELALAVCAVIEDVDHEVSYWAVAHPAGKPDFHHARGFALRLAGG